MTLSSKIEAEGLLAYEQVRAFEQLQRRRLPMIYGIIPLLLVIGGLAMLPMEQPTIAMICLILAVFFLVISWANWRLLQKRYARNLKRLAKLESEYGENLPWLEVERHLAALEQLKTNLADEKRIA